jgi:hypothetical protein
VAVSTEFPNLPQHISVVLVLEVYQSFQRFASGGALIFRGCQWGKLSNKKLILCLFHPTLVSRREATLKGSWSQAPGGDREGGRTLGSRREATLKGSWSQAPGWDREGGRTLGRIHGEKCKLAIGGLKSKPLPHIWTRSFV